jgi:hypothetical protein
MISSEKPLAGASVQTAASVSASYQPQLGLAGAGRQRGHEHLLARRAAAVLAHEVGDRAADPAAARQAAQQRLLAGHGVGAAAAQQHAGLLHRHQRAGGRPQRRERASVHASTPSFSCASSWPSTRSFFTK